MIKDKLKNITIFQSLILGILVFMAYATVNILLKLNENRKYDREAILLEIQKDYPYSKLNFQNIEIVDNSLKVGGKHNNNHYYESAYVYIRYNQLNKEPNFMYVLYGIAPLLFLTIFHQDPRTLKVRDLDKVSFFTYSWIFGSILIFIFLSVFGGSSSDEYYSRRYANPDEFKNDTEMLIKRIDLNNYKLDK